MPVQYKTKIENNLPVNSLQTNESVSEDTCTDAFQVKSGQWMLLGARIGWLFVPERHLKTETLTNAISELRIEIFLFSLNTAGTVSYYFFFFLIVSSAGPALSYNEQDSTQKNRLLKYFIDYLGNTDKRCNCHTKEWSVLTMVGLYRAGQGDRYIIPWRKPQCQIYFNYRLKCIGCFFWLYCRSEISKITRVISLVFFSPQKISNICVPKSLKIL